jgi:hypothetical protein
LGKDRKEKALPDPEPFEPAPQSKGAKAAAAAEQPVKPPARSTLHDEIVTLNLALKAAVRHGWLSAAPDVSAPYNAQAKITHRPWFSPDEYKLLYETSRENAGVSVSGRATSAK